MTTEFTASNGIEIEVSPDGYLLGKGDYGSGPTYATAGPEGIAALREYFQHQRDVELGRWRDEHDPDMVVYPVQADPGTVMVIDEREGVAIPCGRDTFVHAAIEIGDDHTFPITDYDRAAARYFAAHPEPKPWHDAKPGELWILTIDGKEWGAVVNRRGDRFIPRRDGEHYKHLALTDPRIETARRVFPEPEDER